MPRVLYAPEAEDDLVGITEYIARDKPAAARCWLERIRQTCDMLSVQPEAGELRSGFGVPRCRSFSVGNYVIFFRSTDDGIEIARIIHGSRDMQNP